MGLIDLSNAPSGRKSVAHKTPAPPPQRLASLARPRSLQRPLLFCCGIILVGATIKLTGVHLISEFIKDRTQRREERDYKSMVSQAERWKQEVDGSKSG